jgi:hypothetical protein
VIVFAAASCGSDSTGPSNKTYIANLSPNNEVPAKTTTGTGVVTFTDLGTEIDWVMNLNGVTNVIASHIHAPAPAGTNASVIINLYLPNTPPPTGTLTGLVMRGSITNANNTRFHWIHSAFNNGNARQCSPSPIPAARSGIGASS